MLFTIQTLCFASVARKKSNEGNEVYWIMMGK